MRIAIVALFVCSGLFLSAQTSLSGVLHQTEEELLYTENQTWAEFTTQAAAMAVQSFRLKDVETIMDGGERKYWGIWVKSGMEGKQEAMLGWTSLVKEKRKKVEEGYVMTDIEGFAQSEVDHEYVGVWHKGDTPHKVWKLDSQEGVEKKTKEMAALNYYLVDVDCYVTPAKAVNFLALYHFGQVTLNAHIFATTDLKEFMTDLLQRSKSGYRLIDYEKFVDAGKTYYLGVYRKGEYESVLLRDLNKEDFYGTWEQKEKEGLKLVDLELYQKPNKEESVSAQAGK